MRWTLTMIHGWRILTVIFPPFCRTMAVTKDDLDVVKKYFHQNEFGEGAIGIHQKNYLVQLQTNFTEMERQNLPAGEMRSQTFGIKEGVAVGHPLVKDKHQLQHCGQSDPRIVAKKDFDPLNEETFMDFVSLQATTGAEEPAEDAFVSVSPAGESYGEDLMKRPFMGGAEGRSGTDLCTSQPQIVQMQMQIQMMHQQMMMMASKYGGGAIQMPFMGGMTFMGGDGLVRDEGRMGAGAFVRPKGAAASPGDKDLTFEEKRQLVKDINKLQQEQVNEVIQIIFGNKTPQGNNGEIEIEINEIDTSTLRKLQAYVVRPLKQYKGAAEGAKKRKLMEQQASMLQQDD